MLNIISISLCIVGSACFFISGVLSLLQHLKVI